MVSLKMEDTKKQSFSTKHDFLNNLNNLNLGFSSQSYSANPNIAEIERGDKIGDHRVADRELNQQ